VGPFLASELARAQTLLTSGGSRLTIGTSALSAATLAAIVETLA
jgi:hypothetical protein